VLDTTDAPTWADSDWTAAVLVGLLALDTRLDHREALEWANDLAERPAWRRLAPTEAASRAHADGGGGAGDAGDMPPPRA